jgi:hypothetical protein
MTGHQSLANGPSVKIVPMLSSFLLCGYRFPLMAAPRDSRTSPMGQNEPWHSLHRHGRTTSESGPPGQEVGASESGHEQTRCHSLLRDHPG